MFVVFFLFFLFGLFVSFFSKKKTISDPIQSFSTKIKHKINPNTFIKLVFFFFSCLGQLKHSSCNEVTFVCSSI